MTARSGRLPWFKAPVAYSLVLREQRITNNQRASEADAFFEALALLADGRLGAFNLKQFADSLGWSRGKLRRAVPVWVEQVGGHFADMNPPKWWTPQTPVKGEESGGDEHTSDTSRTLRGLSRASSSLVEEEGDRDTAGDGEPLEQQPPPEDEQHQEHQQPEAADPIPALWEAMEAHRTAANPKATARRLDKQRAGWIRTALKTLRAAGAEDPGAGLLQAAEWVCSSTNIRAEGARKTGDALRTLLRPANTRDYWELAVAGEGMVSSRGQAAAPMGSPFDVVLRLVQSRGRDELPMGRELDASQERAQAHAAALRTLSGGVEGKRGCQIGWNNIAASSTYDLPRLRKTYDAAFAYHIAHPVRRTG